MVKKTNMVLSNYTAVVIFSAEHKSKKYTVKYQAFKGGNISHSRPNLSGEIEFYEKQGKARALFRVFKFGYIERNSGSLIPMHPDLLQEFFEKVSYLLLDNKISSDLKEKIISYFDDFQIDITIIEIDRCPICASKDQTTILREESAYKMFNGQLVCRDCALAEVKRELRSRKIHMDPNIETYLKKILKESRNVNSVLKIFEGEQKIGKYTLIKREQAVKPSLERQKVKETRKLHSKIRKTILKRNIKEFTPIQKKSLELGLLDGKNILAVSATSSGKTLIGEMAALTNILRRKKKAIMCVPLVALANTKYTELKQTYSKTIPQVKMGLRVGKTRLRIRNRSGYKNTQLKDTNFIIGSYEGIDKLLRSGINLSDIGCIIIDEIQTLGEEERGPILDGLIARLRVLSKRAQIIGLSATIGNPEEFSSELNMVLARHQGKRPTPLEKHVILALNESNKRRLISQLIWDEKREFKKEKLLSQTIVFTNSRKKTTEISNFLQAQGLSATAYHSGIPYYRKRQIETEFSKGKIDAVVATYALGAGVDFPASTVIFESVLMGIEQLDANTYNQMAGRAGRLGKHKRGRAIFVALPTPPTSRLSRSEYEIAVALSSAALEEIIPDYNEDEAGEQILATICFLGSKHDKGAKLNKVKQIYSMQIGNKIDFNTILTNLAEMNLININQRKNRVYPTELGKASAVAFLKPSETIRIKKLVTRRIPPLHIAVRLEPFENVFHARKIQGWLEKTLNRFHVSTRFFNGPILDLIHGDIHEVKIDKVMQDYITLWGKKIFDCGCEDSPYCRHGEEKLSRGILKLRINKGMEPQEISNYIQGKYGLFIYRGDLLNWLEAVIFLLEGIGRISTVLNIRNDAWKLVRQLEKGGT